jgi:hypothetical protein
VRTTKKASKKARTRRKPWYQDPTLSTALFQPLIATILSKGVTSLGDLHHQMEDLIDRTIPRSHLLSWLKSLDLLRLFQTRALIRTGPPLQSLPVVSPPNGSYPTGRLEGGITIYGAGADIIDDGGPEDPPLQLTVAEPPRRQSASFGGRPERTVMTYGIPGVQATEVSDALLNTNPVVPAAL